MKHIRIPGIDQPCSQLIMGSMVFSEDDMELCTTMLDAFVAAGGNAIDLAHIYNGGHSEIAVGRWLKERDRDKMLIIDKGAHPNQHGARVNSQAIASDLAESLQRLQLDTIDVYMLHRDDPSVPVGEILSILNEHQAAGRIRAFGTSNWTWERIEEANEYAQAHGLAGFSCNSPNLSLATVNEPRWAGCITADEATVAWHQRTEMPLLSWSSQAGGFFTGRFSPDQRNDAETVRVYYNEENWRRFDRAQELAEQKGTDANAIALAYVLHQRFPSGAIIGPRTLEELESSLRVLEVELTQRDIHWLVTGEEDLR